MGLAEFREETFRRIGEDQLVHCLANRYGNGIASVDPVETGVYRVRREDGPDWAVRLFPRYRPVEWVRGEAAILQALAEADYPAERPAVPEPVFVHEGQGGLVTEWVEGMRPRGSVPLFHHLGSELARLAVLPSKTAALARDGGAWHHLGVQGRPADEIRAARHLLAAFGEEVSPRHRPLLAQLRDELEALDALTDLPDGFIHPDFVPRNLLETAAGDRVMIDWTGSGRGPRLAALGFLCWAAGVRSLERAAAAASGYRSVVELESEEMSRLRAAIWYRPLVFAVWGVAMGGQGLTETLRELAQSRELAQAITERAGEALTGRLP